MKKYAKPVGALAVIVGAAIVFGASRGPSGPAVNPDPNHTHADFAVWINGQQLDFTDSRYMSDVPEEGEQQEREANPLRKYLHLHDGLDHVIHRHKPGLTIGEFAASIGMPMTQECVVLDGYQYSQLDDGWKESFAVEPELCANGKFQWKMFVNGTESAFDPSYIFEDTEKILLTYGAGDSRPPVDQMTDDACLYSRTCPERGDPPAENCIADPEVPCVIPE